MQMVIHVESKPTEANKIIPGAEKTHLSDTRLSFQAQPDNTLKMWLYFLPLKQMVQELKQIWLNTWYLSVNVAISTCMRHN